MNDFNPPLVKLLPQEIRTAVLSSGRRKLFTDGQIIHSRGSNTPGLSIILSGAVRFGVYSTSGEYIQTGILFEGHCFGEVTLFTNRERAYDAEAVGDTSILTLGKRRFNELLGDHPGFSTALLLTLTNRLYNTLDFLDDLRTLTIEGRIARQLLRYEASVGTAREVLPVRQVDLAYTLGLSRVSIGNALIRLQEAGSISLGYGKIHILNRALLESWE